MKKYKVTKYIMYSETLVVEAENESEAIKIGMESCQNEERIYDDTLHDIKANEVSPDTPITKEEE